MFSPSNINKPGIPLRLGQLDQVYDTVGSIIENLDEHAIRELTSGYEKDIDNLMNILVDETAQVITGASTGIQSSDFGYLDKFTSSVEETLRCKSLNYFILQCLPEFITGWHNIEWSNLIQMNRQLNVLAARDHGKSYHFSFAYPLWQMYRYQAKSPTEHVPMEFQMAREGMLVTNEYGLAKHLLAIMKEEINQNDILRERLKPVGRDGWGAEQITTKNGASLIIKSAGSKMRGYHPTWMVLDDFLNESSLYSKEQREKYWNIFSAVIMNMLSPGGQMLIVGTPFHEDDLYAQLKKPGSGFKVFEYPAVLPDGTLLFPERHTLDNLLQKKQLLGSLIFSREILVKPITDVASIFPYATLRNAIKGQDTVDVVVNIDSSPRKYVKVVVGCDFAISSNVGADYSVFTILGVDELGLFHILNTVRLHGAGYSKQIAALKRINNDFRPDIIYAEDNGLQQIFIEMMQDANLPVAGKTTNATNKKSLYKGVPSMAVLFETGRIKFPYGSERAKNLTDLYFSELNSVTFIQDTGKLESTSEHDDTAMSLWMAVRAAKSNGDNFDFSFLG